MIMYMQKHCKPLVTNFLKRVCAAIKCKYDFIDYSTDTLFYFFTKISGVCNALF